MPIFRQPPKTISPAQPSIIEKKPAKVAASSMEALEKRYVFDAAIATELQHFIDHGFTGDSTQAPAHAIGETLLAAANSISSDVHKDATPSIAAPADKSVLEKVLGGDISSIALEADPSPREVAFIDGSLKDISTIIADLPKGVEAVVIDPNRDGIAQIATYLDGHPGMSAIHLVAHGTNGELNIGSSVLDSNSINTVYKSALQHIGAQLTENADILIYGCDFAAGSEGAKTEALIAELTGADVAASDHLVGGAQGADWTLDQLIGSVEAQGIVSEDWDHILLTIGANDGAANAIAGIAMTGSLNGQATTDTGAPITYSIADGSGNPLPNGTTILTAHGSVKITDGATGAFTYTANPGFSGTDTFSFVAQADDGTGTMQYAVAFESITVVPAQVVTQNDWASTLGGVAINRTLVTDLVSNPTGATLAYSLTGTAAHGSVVVNADGTFTYTPNAGYVGSDSFTWTATDPSGIESPSTSTFYVTVNSPLSTNYGWWTAVVVGTPVTYDIAGHYIEQTPGATVTFALDPASTINHGTFVLHGDGTFTYTSINDGSATSSSGPTDSFNILATDSNGYTTLIPVYIMGTTSGHGAPTANNDWYGIIEGQTLNNIRPSGYEIETNTVGESLTFTYETTPSKGTFTVNANGTYNYVPEPGPNGLGTYTFNYTVHDQYGQTASATETIVVSQPSLGTTGVVKYSAPGAAVAINLDAQSAHSSADPWVVGGVDGAGNPVAKHLTYTITQQPLHGTLSVDPSNPDGGYIYQPNPGFTGVDKFTYDVFDGYNHVSATDTIISPARIFASSDFHKTAPDTPYSNTVATISGSPSGSLSWVKTFDPAHGTVSLNPDGSYTYTPNNGYHGMDRFGYRLNDGTGHIATAYVDILIPSNPVPGDIPPTSTALPDLINHDSNVVSVSIASHFTNNNPTGALTFYAAGLPTGLTMDPNTGVISGTIDHNDSQVVVNGQYDITVIADDGMGGTTQQTFMWTIVNDNPTVIDHSHTTPINTAVSGNASVGSVDPNVGDTLTFTVAANPSHGTVTMNADGSYTYTPTSGFTGTDTFTYTADDGKGGTVTATETIKVGPSAVNDSYTTPYNTVVNGNAATGDTYVAGSTFVATSAPAHGTVVMNADGTYTYTPSANYTGTDTFTYKVTDPNGLIATATETITITPPAIAAVTDAYTTPFNTPLAGNAATGDTYAPNSVFTAMSTPAHGTVTMNADGTYTYTPTNGYSGPDSFAYKIVDPTGQVAFATETITITPPAIAAVNDAYTTPFNTPLAGNAATGDTYLAGSTFVATSTPSHGTVTMNADGTYTYTPTNNYAGTDTFTYRVTDPSGQVATATETITITPPAIAAVNDSYTTPYNTPVNGNASTGDTYLAGSTFVATSTPSHGTVTMNADGTYTYTPSANYAGTDTFTYRVTDPSGQVATATETITITPPAIAAVNDSYTTPYNTPVNGNASTADTFVPNSIFVATSTPAHGTVVMNADGTYTYTPSANYAGIDTFTYRVTDPTGQVATATETITITPPAIAAVDDGYTTPYNTPVNGNASTADTFVPNSIFVATSTPAHGTVVMNADGTYTYTPSANFAGIDTFTYRVTDPTGQVATATETITITPPAIAAVNDSYTTPYNTPVNGNAATGDTFVPNSVFTATSTPAHGTVVMNADGTYTYTPSANFAGVDTFTYKITDPTGQVATATETITITPPAIGAVDDAYTTAIDTAVNGNAATGDTYVPNSVFVPISTPTHGTVVMNADGTYTYTPNAGYAGLDSFAYKVTDPTGQVSFATETITINPPPAPVAVNDSYTTPYNTPVNGNASNADSYYAPGSTFTATSAPAHGTVTMNADGTYTYTPSANFAGTDTFTYRVTDVTGQVANATETIVITPPPIAAVNDAYTTPFNTPVNGNAATGDTFVANSTFTATSAPAHGTVVMNADGTYTYTPTLNYTGTDTFTYRVTDPTGQVATATETITITPPPILAVNDSYTTPYNTPITKDACANDTFAPGSVFSATSTPSHGTVVMNADGTYTYTPVSTFAGTDTFTYTITDPAGQVSTATETITITPPAIAAVNDAFSTPHATPLVGNAANADTFVTGSVFTALSVPVNGTVVMNADGTYTYTPNPTFFGVDTFTYKITDPTGQVVTAMETITVAPAAPPVALNDTGTTKYVTPLTASLVRDATDPAGYPLNFSLVTGTTHGSVVVNADGTYTYTPNVGFVGTDTFTYKVDNGNGGTANATVTLTVQNPPIVTAPDKTFTQKDHSVIGSIAGDATDPVPGTVLTFSVKTTTTHGTLTVNPDGTFAYVPNTGFVGVDTFVYQVSDGRGGTASNTVTISVNPDFATEFRCLTVFDNYSSLGLVPVKFR